MAGTGQINIIRGMGQKRTCKSRYSPQYGNFTHDTKGMDKKVSVHFDRPKKGEGNIGHKNGECTLRAWTGWYS